MKTLFAVLLLVGSLGAFASENQASDCPRTLHSDERENSKASIQDQSETKSESAGATSV